MFMIPTSLVSKLPRHAHDPLFWKSLSNTFKWTVGVVPAIIIALLVALILARRESRPGLSTIYFVG